MLEALALSLRVEKATLVEDISLEVLPGELLVLLGPNGAGKTSLLRLLSGERRASGGEARMGGCPMARWRAGEAARVRAVLPQNSVLSFPFAVAEVVMMGRSPHIRGIESARDHEVAALAMAETEVLHLRERSFPTLSGGEQQRVHLARVLAQIWSPPPDGASRYLLLDEPTSNLDVAHQHLTMRIGQRMAAEGVAVLAILHDFNLAAMYGDRIAILHNGRLSEIGTPSRVLRPDIIRRVFNMDAIVAEHPQLGCPLVIASTEPLPDSKALEPAHSTASPTAQR